MKPTGRPCGGQTGRRLAAALPPVLCPPIRTTGHAAALTSSKAKTDRLHIYVSVQTRQPHSSFLLWTLALTQSARQNLSCVEQPDQLLPQTPPTCYSLCGRPTPAFQHAHNLVLRAAAHFCNTRLLHNAH